MVLRLNTHIQLNESPTICNDHLGAIACNISRFYNISAL